MAFIRADAAASTEELLVADGDGGGERVLVKRERPRGFISTFYAGALRVGLVAGWTCHRGVRCRYLGGVTSCSSMSRRGRRRFALQPGYIPQGLAWLGPGHVAGPAQDDWIAHQLSRMSYPDGTVLPVTNDLSSYVGVDITNDRTSVVTSRSDIRLRSGSAMLKVSAAAP